MLEEDLEDLSEEIGKYLRANLRITIEGKWEHRDIVDALCSNAYFKNTLEEALKTCVSPQLYEIYKGKIYRAKIKENKNGNKSLCVDLNENKKYTVEKPLEIDETYYYTYLDAAKALIKQEEVSEWKLAKFDYDQDATHAAKETKGSLE